MYRIVLVLLFGITLYAKGTSAGTVINNVATLSFIIDDIPEQIESNVVTDTVAQLIDLHIDSLDSSNVQIQKEAPVTPLSFQITNTGNGLDKFSLQFDIQAKSDFRLDDIKLYIDTNQNKKFDTCDQLARYVTLQADESKMFFLVSNGSENIKISKRNSRCTVPEKKKISKRHNRCYIVVKGTSLTGGSGIAGKVYLAKGISGTDAVDGEKGGIDEAEGVWEYISNNLLFIHQKSTVLNQFGGSEPISGATITYDVTISAGEDVYARNVLYKNPIPNATVYQNNSLKLNGVVLTDAKDSDKGVFDSTNNLIMVNLDHIKSYENAIIQFKVKIQ